MGSHIPSTHPERTHTSVVGFPDTNHPTLSPPSPTCPTPLPSLQPDTPSFCYPCLSVCKSVSVSLCLLSVSLGPCLSVCLFLSLSSGKKVKQTATTNHQQQQQQSDTVHYVFMCTQHASLEKDTHTPKDRTVHQTFQVHMHPHSHPTKC